MKKLVAILLCVTIVFSLSGCFGGKKGEIGKTYNTKEIEFTVNEVAFTDVIDGLGGANDDFWKPIDENNCNVGSRYATVDIYKSAHGLTPKNEDDRIIYISYTVENKTNTAIPITESGQINFDNGDFTTSEGNLAYRVSEEGVWQELPNGISLSEQNGRKYEFRAYTVVPKEVVESDKPLVITLLGYEFEIR